MSTKTLTLTLTTSDLYLRSSQTSPSPPIPSDFPVSKIIPKTRFIIDGFRNAGDFSISYFLTHFHSDYFSGLTSSWSNGVVFCSDTTRRLAVDVLGVSSDLVVRLPVNETVVIDGCEVTLIDANHCAGSVMCLFRIPIGDGKFEKLVHTGHFRYNSDMKLEHAALGKFVDCDVLFLDISYCNPKFVFPSRDESIDYIVSVIDRIGAENGDVKSRVLYLVAADIVGKESVLMEISRRCGRKIRVDSRTVKILHALGCTGESVFTEAESVTDVHIVGCDVLGENWPYFEPNFVNMEGIMAESGYSKAVGFVLTGRTHEVKRNKFVVKTKGTLEIHLVPLKEHSDYDELREYVKFLKPKRVVPSLGYVDSKHGIKLQKHFNVLLDEITNEKECTMVKFVKPMTDGSEMKIDHRTNFITNVFPSNSQKPITLNLALLSEKEKEEIVQELRDCLPIWVSEDQMFELIKIAGKDIVDAVSYFYEHETEFHEQSASTISLAKSNLNIDCTSIPLPGVHEATPPQVGKMPNQNLKFPPLKPSVGSSVSSVKKKKNPGNKQNKKSKVNSNVQHSGVKQSTITKFFSKT